MRPTTVTIACLAAFALNSKAQEPLQPTDKQLTVHWAVGPMIDNAEKDYYNLFPYYSDKEFKAARYVLSEKDGMLYAVITMGNGKDIRRPYTRENYYRNIALIQQKMKKDAPFIYADSTARPDGSKLIILSPFVGEVIDSLEKARYGFFSTMYNKKEFRSARLYETKTGEVLIEFSLSNGSTEKKTFSRGRVEDMQANMANQIGRHLESNATQPSNTVSLNNGKILKGRVVENRQNEVLFETDLEVIVLQKKDIRELK